MNTMQMIFLLFTFSHVSSATVADQFTFVGQGYCKTSDTPAHMPQNRPHLCSWVDAQKGNFEACTQACMQLSACIGIEVNPDEDRCVAYVEYQGATGTASEEVTQQCANLNGNLWVPSSTIEYTGGITHSSGLYTSHTGDCYSFERFDCTVEVFKSQPDNSDSELVSEENMWIDLSLEGVSSLIVTGSCSVTVRDADEKVLATFTEGTYICCGHAADQTRFPGAQGLAWNDRIRSVFLYSTLGEENTEDWNFVDEDSTSYSVSLFSDEEREFLKSGDFEVQCDLSFRLQRDDSKSKSTFTYLDLDTKTVHTQKMRGGYQNHQRFEMPSCTQITCHHAQKSASCPWESKNAILLAVDFRPRSGSAYGKQWNRNRYTFTGTHYYATPIPESRRRLQAGSSLERLLKRFV